MEFSNLFLIDSFTIPQRLWPENQVLAQFQVFFKNKIKTAISLMHYVALRHWSKLKRI